MANGTVLDTMGVEVSKPTNDYFKTESKRAQCINIRIMFSSPIVTFLKEDLCYLCDLEMMDWVKLSSYFLPCVKKGQYILWNWVFWDLREIYFCVYLWNLLDMKLRIQLTVPHSWLICMINWRGMQWTNCAHGYPDYTGHCWFIHLAGERELITWVFLDTTLFSDVIW